MYFNELWQLTFSMCCALIGWELGWPDLNFASFIVYMTLWCHLVFTSATDPTKLEEWYINNITLESAKFDTNELGMSLSSDNIYSDRSELILTLGVVEWTCGNLLNQ